VLIIIQINGLRLFGGTTVKPNTNSCDNPRPPWYVNTTSAVRNFWQHMHDMYSLHPQEDAIMGAVKLALL
jgi:hypothetical protein